VCHLIELFKFLSDSDDSGMRVLEQIPQAFRFHIVLQCGLEVFMAQHNVEDPMVDDTRQQRGKALPQIMEPCMGKVGTP
jgi:hypothetical protein